MKGEKTGKKKYLKITSPKLSPAEYIEELIKKFHATKKYDKL